MNLHPRRRILLNSSRRGFTLVEMLAVMGIIILLISILVPTVISSRKKAAAARIRRDIDTLALALESYQQTWNCYPVFDSTNIIPPALNPDSVLVTNKYGDNALYTALATRGRLRPGGVPYGPFINADQFKIDAVKMQIKDKDDNVFCYFPANQPVPDLHKFFLNQPSKPSFVGDWNPALAPPNPKPLYDHRGFPPSPANVSTTLNLADMRSILGDFGDGNGGAPNGIIDPANTGSNIPAEVPAHTGPFLLWHPGSDDTFGLKTVGGRLSTDDVTNFEIPIQYKR